MFRLEPGDVSSSSSSSSCGSPPPSPLIFSNALHVAVEHGAVEVARLLLKYGLEPNQGGRLPFSSPQGFFAQVPESQINASKKNQSKNSLTSSCRYCYIWCYLNCFKRFLINQMFLTYGYNN